MKSFNLCYAIFLLSISLLTHTAPVTRTRDTQKMPSIKTAIPKLTPEHLYRLIISHIISVQELCKYDNDTDETLKNVTTLFRSRLKELDNNKECEVTEKMLLQLSAQQRTTMYTMITKVVTQLEKNECTQTNQDILKFYQPLLEVLKKIGTKK